MLDKYFVIDIVTVIFEPELPVLEVQAQSVSLFCQDLGMKNIWVVVNDLDQVAEKINPDWWGDLSGIVRVVPRSHFGDQWSENGWVSQQALKLLTSTLSSSPWAMILDAKTVMTNHAREETFIVDHQTLTLGTAEIQPVFQTSADIASNLLGIQVDRVAAPAGVPFFFETATVRELVQHVEQVTGAYFAEWFQDQAMLTEFILYTAFAKYRYKDLDKIYTNTNKQKLCNNICHSQWHQFDQLMLSAKQQRPLTIGVHRNAWNRLSLQQKRDYVDFLNQFGITKAELLL